MFAKQWLRSACAFAQADQSHCFAMISQTSKLSLDERWAYMQTCIKYCASADISEILLHVAGFIFIKFLATPPIIDFQIAPKSRNIVYQGHHEEEYTNGTTYGIDSINQNKAKYSRLSLSLIPRDSLKHFEISVPRHIRVAEVRKTINRTTTFNKWICNLTPEVRNICLFVLRFYGPVNPMGSCRARSVYLTTRLLGRLSRLSG